MIPLGDGVKRRRFPYATLALVLAETAAFVAWLLLPPAQAATAVARFALVPAQLVRPDLAPALAADPRALPALLTLVTSLFLHGGVLHLGGNLLFLWAFGRSVEEEMGPRGFL